MIRCTKCQTINTPEAVFCVNCASFLEWTGVPATPEQVAAATARPAPAASPAESPPESPAPPPVTEQPKPAAELVREPSAARKSEPAAAPEPEPASQPVPEPLSASEPPAEAVAPLEPALETEPAPDAKSESTPEPQPDSTAAPEPEPTAAPEPEPTAAPEPEPTAAPEPEPTAAPEPEPKPEAAAAVLPPAPAAAPDVEPEPVAQEQPQPATPQEALQPSPQPAPSFQFRAPPATPRPSRIPTQPDRSVPSSIAPTPTTSPGRGQPGSVRPALQPPSRPPTTVSQPGSRQPTTVPTRPLRPPPQPRPDRVEPPIKPGDLVCQVCGAGNARERRFCRRCGNSLATAVVAIRPPWWRRLFGRNQRAVAAGERPRSMGERGQPRSSLLKRVLLVGLVLLILAPIVGYFTVPAVKQSVDGVISRALIAITLSQNPSGNAIDGNVATVWLADPGGTPPTLTVNFTDVTDLAGMVFQIGPAPGANYTANARPRQVELDFHDGAKPVLLDLEDDPVPQTECLKPNRQVQTFDMRVVSTYPPATGGQNLIALREVKFLSGSC